MRASTVRCRFLDRCGDSLGVESSFFRIFVYSHRRFFQWGIYSCYRLRARVGYTGRFVVGRGRGWSVTGVDFIPMRFFSRFQHLKNPSTS